MSSAVLMVLVLLSAVEPSSIDLAQGWRLRSEAQPSDTSMSSIDLDDSDWTIVAAGARWEDQSFNGMNGYAWYRRQVEVPPSWQGQRVWLALGGVSNPYPSNYAHTLGAFNQEHPAYINYVRLVFKSGREPVELRITDWGTADTPVGTAGQDLGVNFVQVQPYLMPSQN
ncbi:MAG: hypothetical protein RBU21_08380 [FCB group bacterium]|jgi:hypothetical protein|nr:hypothetical protein [FCB group bacterium]